MMKIMSSGFEVWVDTTGKKKQNVGLLFIPEHNPMEGERHSFIPGQKPDINMLKQRLLLSMNEIRTKGLAKLGETSIPFRNNTGIHTALNVNAKGDIVFELILPLGEIYKEKNNYLNQKKPISVGLIINAPKRHEEGEDQELKHGGDEEGMNGQGMYRGGGGGMHGGVGGGGMRHGGGHNMESGEMSTSDVEWQQLKLINQ
jgi:hypothetical protein